MELESIAIEPNDEQKADQTTSDERRCRGLSGHSPLSRLTDERQDFRMGLTHHIWSVADLLRAVVFPAAQRI